MTRDTLQFVHSTTAPTEQVRVFDECSVDLLGTEFRCRVIGSSHYVSAPALDFHELSTCDPVDCEGKTTIPLEEGGRTRRLSHETDRLRCETEIEHRPLSAFPEDGEFDLAYWFGGEAVTTITVDDDGYENYHTYPEFDLALYTRTLFLRVEGVDATSLGSHLRSGSVPGTD